MILRVGDRVRIIYDGSSVVGEVLTAGGNEAGITVAFDGHLGIYTGIMPITWMHDHYEDQGTGHRVMITRLARVLPWPGAPAPAARRS